MSVISNRDTSTKRSERFLRICSNAVLVALSRLEMRSTASHLPTTSFNVPSTTCGMQALFPVGADVAIHGVRLVLLQAVVERVLDVRLLHVARVRLGFTIGALHARVDLDDLGGDRIEEVQPSGSDSEVILPKRVSTPRWPVSTTLTPQPAMLTTRMATARITAHITILRIGSSVPPPPGFPTPRSTDVLKAMNRFSPLKLAAPQAGATVGRHQRDGP
jgi:hypothetical protein